MKFLTLSRFIIQIQTNFWGSYCRRVKSFSDPIKGIRQSDSDFLGQSETFSVALSTCIAGISKYSQGNAGEKMVFKDVLGEHAKTLSFVTYIRDQFQTIIWIDRKVE